MKRLGIVVALVCVAATAAAKPACDNSWRESWRPLQSGRAVTKVACRRPGCVDIAPLASDIGGADGICVVRPRLRSTPGVVVAAAQAALDDVVSLVTDDGDGWLMAFDYTVHHDANGILDVTFRASGRGAQISLSPFHLALDLRTGARLTAATAFRTDRLSELRTVVASHAHGSWRRAQRRHPDILAAYGETTITLEDLDDFVVLDRAVVFFVDYGIPNIAGIATPVSELPVSRDELRRFIRVPGPLSWMM